jgi:Meiotically up-regulated gene 113
VVSKPAWVYLLRCGKYGKLGNSTDVRRRMKELQTGSPLPIELYGAVFHSNAEWLEQQLHKKYQKYHFYGEWFEFPDGKWNMVWDDMTWMAAADDITDDEILRYRYIDNGYTLCEGEKDLDEWRYYQEEEEFFRSLGIIDTYRIVPGGYRPRRYGNDHLRRRRVLFVRVYEAYKLGDSERVYRV